MNLTKSLLRFLYIVLLPIPLVAQRPCLVVEDIYLEKDSIYKIPVKSIHFDTVVAFQFMLGIDRDALTPIQTEVQWNPTPNSSYINDQLKDFGWIRFLWTDDNAVGLYMQENVELVHLTFKAGKSGLLSNYLYQDNSLVGEHADANSVATELNLTYLEGICDNPLLGYSGALFKDAKHRPVPGMQVGTFSQRVSQKNGSLLFLFDEETSHEIKNASIPVLSGVDGEDFQLLRKHLNGSAPFQEVYQWLAGDLSEDRKVDQNDLEELFLQLFEISEKDWSKNHVNTYYASIASHESSPGILVAPLKQTDPVKFNNPRLDSFLVIKQGDFNGSYVPGFTGNSSGAGRGAGVDVEWQYDDRVLVAGQTTEVTISSKPFDGLLCMVGYLTTDLSKTKIKNIKNFNTSFWAPSIVREVSPGIWKLVWYNLAGKSSGTEQPLFVVEFEDVVGGETLHNAFSLSNDYVKFTVAEIDELNKGNLEMTFLATVNANPVATVQTIHIQNPVNRELKILDSHFPVGSASIYNLHGQKVHGQELETACNTISLPDLPDGSYLLQIQKGPTLYRTRFVKIQSHF